MADFALFFVIYFQQLYSWEGDGYTTTSVRVGVVRIRAGASAASARHGDRLMALLSPARRTPMCTVIYDTRDRRLQVSSTNVTAFAADAVIIKCKKRSNRPGNKTFKK